MRALGAAFAGVATLLVLQSLLARVIEPGDRGFAAVGVAMHVGFVAVDVLLVVALVRLGSSARLRGLAVAAALVASYEVVTDVAGLLRPSGNAAAGLSIWASPRAPSVAEGLSTGLGAGEPYIAIGLSLLGILVIRAYARDRAIRLPSALTWGIVLAAAASLGFRLYHPSVYDGDSHMRSAWLPWGSWLVELGRVLTVAVAALVVIREEAQRRASGAAPAEGPYRTPDAPPGSSSPGTAAPTALTALADAALARLDSALSLYIGGLGARLVLGAFLIVLLLVTVAARVEEAASVAMILGPFGGVATAIVLTVALVRLTRASRFEAAPSRFIGACLLIAVAGLGDLALLGFGLAWLHEGPVPVLVGAECLLVTPMGVAALFLAASAFSRVGAAFGEEVVVSRARGALGFAVAALVLPTAAIAAATVDPAYQGRATLEMLAMALALLGCAAYAAAVVFQVLAVSRGTIAVRAALRARLPG